MYLNWIGEEVELNVWSPFSGYTRDLKVSVFWSLRNGTVVVLLQKEAKFSGGILKC